MPFFDNFASPRWSPLRMRTKVVSFFIFFQELSNKKKFKALRPKMTKIASRGGSSREEKTARIQAVDWRKNELHSCSTDQEWLEFMFQSPERDFLHPGPCILGVWKRFALYNLPSDVQWEDLSNGVFIVLVALVLRYFSLSEKSNVEPSRTWEIGRLMVKTAFDQNEMDQPETGAGWIDISGSVLMFYCQRSNILVDGEQHGTPSDWVLAYSGGSFRCWRQVFLRVWSSRRRRLISYSWGFAFGLASGRSSGVGWLK